MIKRVLIFVFILFITILAVGCSNTASQDPKEIKDAHQDVLDNINDYYLIKRHNAVRNQGSSSDFVYEFNITKADVDKFFEVAEALFIKSEYFGPFVGVEDKEDWLNRAVTIANGEDSGNISMVSIEKSEKNLLFVAIIYQNPNKRAAYKVVKSEKYIQQFEQLVTDLFE